MNALELNELHDIDEIVAEKDRFKIESVDQANWALRKLAAIRSQVNETKALGESELQRIKAWMEFELRKLEDNAGFFEGLLTEYALLQRAGDPSFKKLSTPYGSVKIKKNLDKWDYDEATLLESLESAGLHDLIRIKKEPNKVDLKKRVTVYDGQVVDPDTGAILEGVKVLPQPESVVIEL